MFYNRKINRSQYQMLGNEFDIILQTVMGRAPLNGHDGSFDGG